MNIYRRKAVMIRTLNQIIISTMFTLVLSSAGQAALQVNLEVSTPDAQSDTGIATNNIAIGTDHATTDSYDNLYDTVALLDGPVQAYVAHSDYPAENQKLWRDYRSDDTLPKEWTIEVLSTDGKNVNMKWDIETTDNLIITLTDMSSNQEIDMSSTPEYSFQGISGTPMKLLLRVAENTNSTTDVPVIGNDNSVGDTSNDTGSTDTGVSNNSGGPKGGGCGYIKDIGGNGRFPGGTGTAAINMTILFTPFIWLISRKNLKSQVSASVSRM